MNWLRKMVQLLETARPMSDTARVVIEDQDSFRLYIGSMGMDGSPLVKLYEGFEYPPDDFEHAGQFQIRKDDISVVSNDTDIGAGSVIDLPVGSYQAYKSIDRYEVRLYLENRDIL